MKLRVRNVVLNSICILFACTFMLFESEFRTMNDGNARWLESRTWILRCLSQMHTANIKISGAFEQSRKMQDKGREMKRENKTVKATVRKSCGTEFFVWEFPTDGAYKIWWKRVIKSKFHNNSIGWRSKKKRDQDRTLILFYVVHCVRNLEENNWFVCGVYTKKEK